MAQHIAKSSINFQQSKKDAFSHNSRAYMPPYAIKDRAIKNECDLDAEQAELRYRTLREQAEAKYKERTKQNMKLSEDRYRWSAVVNLNERHTLKDLKRLADKLAAKYGWQVLQCAVHRDEGHKTKDNDYSINYHGHIEFLMIDENGIYNFKKRDMGKKTMSEIQSLVASELGMQRGVKYHENAQVEKPVRMSHKEFRRHKKAVESLENELGVAKATISDLKAENKLYRDELKMLKAKRADYAALEALKNDLEQKVRDNVISQKELKESYANAFKALKGKLASQLGAVNVEMSLDAGVLVNDMGEDMTNKDHPLIDVINDGLVAKISQYFKQIRNAMNKTLDNINERLKELEDANEGSTRHKEFVCDVPDPRSIAKKFHNIMIDRF